MRQRGTLTAVFIGVLASMSLMAASAQAAGFDPVVGNSKVAATPAKPGVKIYGFCDEVSGCFTNMLVYKATKTWQLDGYPEVYGSYETYKSEIDYFYEGSYRDTEVQLYGRRSKGGFFGNIFINGSSVSSGTWEVNKL